MGRTVRLYALTCVIYHNPICVFYYRPGTGGRAERLVPLLVNHRCTRQHKHKDRNALLPFCIVSLLAKKKKEKEVRLSREMGCEEAPPRQWTMDTNVSLQEQRGFKGGWLCFQMCIHQSPRLRGAGANAGGIFKNACIKLKRQDATNSPNAGEINGEQGAAAVKRFSNEEIKQRCVDVRLSAGAVFWIKSEGKLLDNKHEKLSTKRAQTPPADRILCFKEILRKIFTGWTFTSCAAWFL